MNTFLSAITVMSVFAAAPAGWQLAGSDRNAYVATVERGPEGQSVAHYASKRESEGFGTLMQTVKADKYLGKRVRYSAKVKHRNVSAWAGLWMRVDGKDEAPLGFDNMENRALKGTGDWKQYEVVLDVPDTAVAIAFGILLEGQGEVWIADVNVKEVDKSVAVTSSLAPEPVLDFQ